MLIIIGELLKIVLVEQLFEASGDKLMSIRWFAWGFNVAAGWLAGFRALPLVQATRMRINTIKKILRHYLHFGHFSSQGRAKSRVVATDHRKDGKKIRKGSCGSKRPEIVFACPRQCTRGDDA